MKMLGLADQVRALCENLDARIARDDGRIIAIAMVRSEEDIVERFVRHCLTWADALLIVDHASCDETPVILQKLIEEGLCLGVVPDNAVGKHQADRMTMLARAAAIHLSGRVIVPLDADEFLIHEGDESIRAHLSSLPPDKVASARWRNYVPTPLDNRDEPDVLRRITYRTAEPSEITKAIFGGKVAAADDFRIGHGSHWLSLDGMRVYRSIDAGTFYLAHFPVRSAGQITAKTVITPLAGMLDLERFPTAQQHYSELRDRVRIHSYMSPVELQRAAENYAVRSAMDLPTLVCAPINDTSGPLRYTPASVVDAAYRLEQFARSLVERLVAVPNGGDEPVAIRQLISAENDRLHAENERLQREVQLLAALRSNRIFRFALSVRRVWKRLLRP